MSDEMDLTVQVRDNFSCEVCGVRGRPLYHFYVDVMTCKDCTPTPDEAPAIFRQYGPPELFEDRTDEELRQEAQEWWDRHVK